MPLYEYHCDACGRQFELIRKFSDLPLDKCPHCGSTVRKLFSSPAIQFKGSGFYITDYAKKEQTPTTPSDGAKPDAASKDKGAGEKSGENSAKTEKSHKSEKTSKDDKTSAKTDGAPAKAAPKDGS